MNTKSTILIVDDEPVNLTLLADFLSDLCQVRVANSGKRALEVVNTDPRPDLILLDIMMPDMNGYSVIARLKADPVTEDIPVIFVTAMDDDTDVESGLEHGAVDYITKPIHLVTLLARVKAHLLLKHSRDFLNDKNAYLEAEISRRMKENLAIQDVTIRALAHLAETRDPETGDHIRRTQSYVKVLATKLQSHPRFSETITNEYIGMVTRSAPLHDIGKVGIPDHVLLKSGELDEKEWEVMKTHTELGANAIGQSLADIEYPIQFLTLGKEIAHWHHEKWDGSGYPDGLSGDNIPISARLMAVADVFDALTTPRVYKDAMPADQAREIIVQGRAKRFDPDIVDAFQQCYDQFVEIADKHQRDG